jgi:hypothetical protein
MEINQLKENLAYAVTRYDRKQATKRSYNVYALSQYLTRVDDIIADVENGAEIGAAIVAGFTPGPLRNACMKSVDLSVNDIESSGSYLGMPVYKPVSFRK